MTLLKVSDCRAILDRDRDSKTSLSDLSASLFLDIINAINEDYFKREFYANPQKHEKQSVVASGASHEFADILTVNYLTGGVYKRDENGNVTEDKLSETGEGSRQTGWYFKDKTLYFTPVGSSGVNYVLKSIEKTERLSAESTTLIDDSNSEFVKRAMLRQVFIWNEKGSLSIQDALYREEINNMILAPSRQHGLSTNTAAFA